MATSTLLEWMGGLPKLQALLESFYRRVPADPLLAPVFARMPPEHAHRVAGAGVSGDAPMPAWGWGETGGPCIGS